MTAIVKQQALPRALWLYRVFQSPRPGCESSQMLSPGLTAAMESPGGVRTGTCGSPWGETSLSSARSKLRDGSS